MKLITSLILFAFSIGVFAQAGGNFIYQQSNRYNYKYSNPAANANFNNDQSVQLEINALMNVEADSYLAIFNMVQVGETASISKMGTSDTISANTLSVVMPA